MRQTAGFRTGACRGAGRRAVGQAALVVGQAGLLGASLGAGFAPQAFAAASQRAVATVRADRVWVGDGVCGVGWALTKAGPAKLVFQDAGHHRSVGLDAPFTVRMRDGSTWSASALRVVGKPVERRIAPDAAAVRQAERVGGVAVSTQMETPDRGLTLTWTVTLRDGAHYVTEDLTLQAGGEDQSVAEVELLHAALPGAHVEGSVKGSPIVAGDIFLGFQHPLSTSSVSANGMATASMTRVLPLRAQQSITYTAVMGAARTGQMRRDFLAYVEQERAHPYRTFLHYNSWYDLGFFSPYTQSGAVDRIRYFGTELHEKRGVTLDSFLFDDGWDDHKSMWNFHPKDFPEGFDRVRDAAAQFGTAPGVWMSPWGGYGQPKKDRVAAGRKQGFETAGNGFALSGPKYYDRFHQICFEMIRKYGVNQFKFDGTGNADSVVPGSAFDSDFSAALRLIDDLRKEKPDLYVNLTTGTYPSPFWLMTADSIWRGGEDDDVAGVGPYRERWITYRDADTYKQIVKAGPLFPLNSVMLHGLIYAQHHKQLKADPSNSFRNEVRSYFGTGTQLQELYITPSLLTAQNWDDLAEAAKWSRTNAGVLKDTHWVGGDPAALQVYGWASWSPAKAILTLRNPSDKASSITVDPQEIFELPRDAARSFTAHSPWQSDGGGDAVSLKAGEPHTFALAPFQVLTIEAVPQTGPQSGPQATKRR